MADSVIWDDAPEHPNSVTWDDDGPPTAKQTLKRAAATAAATKPSDVTSAIGDMAGGIRASTAKLVFGGADLLNRATGLPRKINDPAVQSAITPPPSAAGTFGDMLGTGLQFLAPETAIGKGVKLAETLSAGTKLAKALPFVARVAGDAAGAAGVEGVRSGGDPNEMGKAALTAGGISAAAKAAPIAYNIAKQILGKSTGAGSDAIEMAATTSSQKFKDAMRNKVTETQIISDLKDAVKTVQDNRAAAYTKQLGALDNTIVVPKLPVGQSLMNEFSNFRISPQTGLHDLDFSNSFLKGSTRAADRKLIQDATNDISLWNDQTPAGMDQLKRMMYDYAKDASPDVAPLFYRLGGTVKGQLETGVPGYRQMTADYSKASDMLNDVNRELSVNALNPGTTITKISGALNRRDDYRKMLIDMLDNAAGSELHPTIAGYNLRKAVPSGLQGVAATSIPAMAAYASHPAVAVGSVLASPRAVGEGLALLSTLRRGVQQYIPQAVRDAVRGAVRPIAAGATVNLLEKPPANFGSR